MRLTILNNGKLMKPQTLRDDKLEDLLLVETPTVKGVSQETAPTELYEHESGWKDWTQELLTGYTHKTENDVTTT